MSGRADADAPAEPGDTGTGRSEAVTRGIRVEVRARYVPEQSRPEAGRWFFAYHVRIANLGSTVVRLTHRRWVITDARGNQEVVEGPGVVGHQPFLGPGETHEYTSFCPLETAFGTMEGSYRMVPQDGGDAFDARIAPFTLAEPFAVN